MPRSPDSEQRAQDRAHQDAIRREIYAARVFNDAMNSLSDPGALGQLARAQQNAFSQATTNPGPFGGVGTLGGPPNTLHGTLGSVWPGGVVPFYGFDHGQPIYTRPVHKLPATRDKLIICAFAAVALFVKCKLWAWSL